MKAIARSLIMFGIAGMLLVSCGFPSNAEVVANATPEIQATQSLADKVSIELTVQYDTAATYNTVGQIVRFTYNIKMIRNDLTDDTPANIGIVGITANCPALDTINNQDNRFDPGEVLQCTGDYLLTQADLDRGSVSNVATAVAYTVNSNTVTTNVPTVSPRALTLTKTANPTTYNSVNQQITFAYTITNSGTVQLGPAQFTVTDSGINNNAAFNCGSADVTLAPGANLTCSATYQVTAADTSAASISHTATASGGGVTSAAAAITLTKSTTPTTTSGTTVQHTVRKGEWLWQIARCYAADPQETVKANPQVDPYLLSTGTIVTVPGVGSTGKTVHAPPEPCVQFHLVQSGDTWTSIAQKYNADPGLTQMVNSNAMTIGKEVKVPLYTFGLNIPLSGTTATAIPSSTALGLTVTPNATSYSQAGQTITFDYVIKNNGTTTLGPTQFVINDALMNPTALNCGPANTTLAPGASTTCTNTYSVTEANMGAANIQFSTTATGSGAASSSAVVTTLTKNVGVLTLSITPSTTTYNQAGQTINFSYVIKNTGTTSVGPAQFTITSNLLNPAIFNCGAANTTLAPNAEVTCSAGYSITEADMSVVNIQFSATASGGGLTSQAVPVTITKQ